MFYYKIDVLYNSFIECLVGFPVVFEIRLPLGGAELDRAAHTHFTIPTIMTVANSFISYL